ncbi:MAG: ATP-binding protein [Phycisphaerales bacterium JB043]
MTQHHPRQPRRPDPSDPIPNTPTDTAARTAASSHGAAEGASEDFALRFGALTHELRGLVDGSMRFLSMASQGLQEDDPADDEARAMMRQIDSARDGLLRMSTLLQRAMQPNASLNSIWENSEEPLVEALLHAADSMRAVADDRGIRLNVECSPRLVLTPAGPVYTILVNALRNSFEAIGLNGTVEVIAELATKDSKNPVICLDVLDDGPGPRRGAEPYVFKLGYSTRVHGDGIGLALIKELVTQNNGTVTLKRRLPDRPTWSQERPGAHLSIRIPAPMVFTP